MAAARIWALIIGAFAPFALAAGPSAVPASFRFDGTTNRFITPNGDGKNDTTTFRFANPRASSGSVRIFTLRGREVESISIPTGAVTATWAPGSGTASGVYVFVIRLDDSSYSGAVAVVR